MVSTHKCLNGTQRLKVLGSGKQTILIRNYKTNVNMFLLYPNVSYSLKDDYLDSFQNKHKYLLKKMRYLKKMVTKYWSNISQHWKIY